MPDLVEHKKMSAELRNYFWERHDVWNDVYHMMYDVCCMMYDVRCDMITQDANDDDDKYIENMPSTCPKHDLNMIKTLKMPQTSTEYL